jgi:hypothetical protein
MTVAEGHAAVNRLRRIGQGWETVRVTHTTGRNICSLLKIAAEASAYDNNWHCHQVGFRRAV